MSDIFNILLSVVMVIAPTIGYFDQYRIILKNKTSAGFNSITCAILCFANILRLFFWFGKRFDITLLFQSIAMLISILTLLELVIRYKPSNRIQLVHHEVELKWYQRQFWNWDHFIDYVNCLLIFTSIIGVLYILLYPYHPFIEILGFLSLGIESTLPLPQVLTHFKHKSTKGFSLLILASWFLGDGFKAFYFIYQQSPIQFVVCAIIQLSLDTVIVFQFIFFSNYIKKLLGSAPILLQEDNEEEYHYQIII